MSLVKGIGFYLQGRKGLPKKFKFFKFLTEMSPVNQVNILTQFSQVAENTRLNDAYNYMRDRERARERLFTRLAGSLVTGAGTYAATKWKELNQVKFDQRTSDYTQPEQSTALSTPNRPTGVLDVQRVSAIKRPRVRQVPSFRPGRHRWAHKYIGPFRTYKWRMGRRRGTRGFRR